VSGVNDVYRTDSVENSEMKVIQSSI